MSGFKEREGRKWKEKNTSNQRKTCTSGSITSQGSSSLRRPQIRATGRPVEIETIMIADNEESVSPRARDVERSQWRPKTHFKATVDYNDITTNTTTSPFNTRSPTYPSSDNHYTVQRSGFFDGSTIVYAQPANRRKKRQPDPASPADSKSEENLVEKSPTARYSKEMEPEEKEPEEKEPKEKELEEKESAEQKPAVQKPAEQKKTVESKPAEQQPPKCGNVCDVPACPVVKKNKLKEKICRTDECPTVIKKKVIKDHKKGPCPKKNPLTMIGAAVMNAFTDRDASCKLSKEEKKCWKKMKTTNESCDDEFENLDSASCGGRSRKSKEVQCKRPTATTDKGNVCGASPQKVSRSTACDVPECPISMKKKRIQKFIDKACPSVEAQDRQEVTGCLKKEKKSGTPRGCPGEQCTLKEKDQAYFNKCVGSDILEKCPRLKLTCEEAHSGKDVPKSQPPTENRVSKSSQRPPDKPPSQRPSENPAEDPPNPNNSDEDNQDDEDSKPPKKANYTRTVANVQVLRPIENPFLTMTPDMQIYPINTAKLVRRKSRERRESNKKPMSRIPIEVVVGSDNIHSSISATTKDSSPLVDNEDGIPTAKADNPQFSNIFVDKKDLPESKESADRTDLHGPLKSVMPRMSNQILPTDAISGHRYTLSVAQPDVLPAAQSADENDLRESPKPILLETASGHPEMPLKAQPESHEFVLVETPKMPRKIESQESTPSKPKEDAESVSSIDADLPQVVSVLNVIDPYDTVPAGTSSSETERKGPKTEIVPPSPSSKFPISKTIEASPRHTDVDAKDLASRALSVSFGSGSIRTAAPTPSSTRPSFQSERESPAGSVSSKSNVKRIFDKHHNLRRGSRHSGLFRKLPIKVFVVEAQNSKPTERIPTKTRRDGEASLRDIVIQTTSDSAVAENGVGNLNESEVSPSNILGTSRKHREVSTESTEIGCSSHPMSENQSAPVVATIKRSISNKSLLIRSSSRNIETDTINKLVKKTSGTTNKSETSSPKSNILRSLFSGPLNNSEKSLYVKPSHFVIGTPRSELWDSSERSLSEKASRKVFLTNIQRATGNKKSGTRIDNERSLSGIFSRRSVSKNSSEVDSSKSYSSRNLNTESLNKPASQRRTPWSDSEQNLKKAGRKKMKTQTNSGESLSRKPFLNNSAEGSDHKLPGEVVSTGSNSLHSLYMKFMKRSRPSTVNEELNLPKQSSLKNVDPEPVGEPSRKRSKPWGKSEQSLSEKLNGAAKLKADNEWKASKVPSLKNIDSNDSQIRSKTNKQGIDIEQSGPTKRPVLKRVLPVASLKRTSESTTSGTEAENNMLKPSSSKTIVTQCTLCNFLDTISKQRSNSAQDLSSGPPLKNSLTEADTIVASLSTNDNQEISDVEQGVPKKSSMKKWVTTSFDDTECKLVKTSEVSKSNAPTGLEENVSKKSLKSRKSVNIIEDSSGTCKIFRIPSGTQTLTQSALHPNSQTTTGVEMAISFVPPNPKLANPEILVAHLKKNYQQCSYMTDVTEESMFLRNKITVVGAGSVGSACAMSLLHKNITREIMFYDYLASPRLLADTIDFQQASLYLGNPNVYCTNDTKDTAKSRIIIITGGIGMETGQSNTNVVEANAQSMKCYVKELAIYSPDAVFLVISEPVDIMAWVTWRMTGLPLNQVVGSGTNLDSARFRDLLAKKLGLAPASVYGWIIGEHGEHSVPVWSSVNVAGVMLTDLTGSNLANEWSDIHAAVVRASSDVNNVKGFSEWAIGLSCTELCEVILYNKQSVHSVSTLARGYHGVVSEVFLSLPCVLGENGVKSVIKQRLLSQEEQLFRKSAICILEVQTACHLNLPPGKTIKLPEETEQYPSKSLSD